MVECQPSTLNVAGSSPVACFMDEEKKTRQESIMLVQHIKQELLDQISLGETCIRILKRDLKFAEADITANKVKERRIIVSALKRLEKQLHKEELSDDDKFDVVEEILNIRTCMKNLEQSEQGNSDAGPADPDAESAD